MSKGKMIKDLQKAILEYNPDASVATTKKIIEMKIDPQEAIENGLIPAIKEVGDKFEKMEIFLLELMLAADATKASMNLLLPLIPKDSKGIGGNVVIGTVQGDVHEIGKNIVANMLMTAGFNVNDMGVDVKSSSFIDVAKKSNAKIIGASALMSSTMGSQKDIVDYLSATGDRKKFAVLIGGGITSKAWADEIGADGYGEDAVEAVKLAKKFAK